MDHTLKQDFALQRNSALFLLLHNYHTKFKDKKYFIYFEHYDDFLFCFLDKNSNANAIEAYQSKKKSTGNWTLTKKIFLIITKLLKTGNNLIQDKIPKAKNYYHHLYFSSNSPIFLEDKVSKNNITITEYNSVEAYNELAKEIRIKIKKGVEDKTLHSELKNLHFLFIDLNRTDEEQQNNLAGKIQTVFGKDITDYKAAVTTLISIFHGIEKTFNQKGEVKLSDETKRVSSDKINETLKIITNESKAFEYWLSEYKTIRKSLKIRPFEDDSFKLYFTSAFQLFKSIKEVEHQKIFKFVKNNYKNCNSFQEEDNILELFSSFKNEKNTLFDDLKLKGILYAAYFEVTNKKDIKS